jgi:hypothetical protein
MSLSLSQQIDINFPTAAKTALNVAAMPVIPGPKGCMAILGPQIVLHPQGTSAGTKSLLHDITS